VAPSSPYLITSLNNINLNSSAAALNAAYQYYHAYNYQQQQQSNQTYQPGPPPGTAVQFYEIAQQPESQPAQPTTISNAVEVRPLNTEHLIYTNYQQQPQLINSSVGGSASPQLLITPIGGQQQQQPTSQYQMNTISFNQNQ